MIYIANITRTTYILQNNTIANNEFIVNENVIEKNVQYFRSTYKFNSNSKQDRRSDEKLEYKIFKERKKKTNFDDVF
jgi:hypothetical protein